MNVVVIYYDSGGLNKVNYNIGQHLVTWRVWITNSQWQADMTGTNFMLDPFHGTLIFSNHHEEISGFKNFVQAANPLKYPEDTYLTMYWHKNFHCSFSDSNCALRNCTPNASLAWLPVSHFDPAMSVTSYNIYNTVYAEAHALHAMLLQQEQRQEVGSKKAMEFSAWQVLCFPLGGMHYHQGV